jgi:hypothetical protein
MQTWSKEKVPTRGGGWIGETSLICGAPPRKNKPEAP